MKSSKENLLVFINDILKEQYIINYSIIPFLEEILNTMGFAV